MLRLVAAQPDNKQWQSDLSKAYSLMGIAQQAAGRISESAQSYSEGVVLMERLAQSEPSNNEWQLRLSKLHNALGAALLAHGRLPKARESRTKSLAIVARLASHSDTPALQSQLADTYFGLGDVQWAEGNLGAAVTSVSTSVRLMEKLASSDPSTATWQRELSKKYNKLVELQIQAGTLGDALKSATASVTIMERLIQTDPNNADWQHDLSVSYLRSGDVRRWRADFPQALQFYSRGVDIRVRTRYSQILPIASCNVTLPTPRKWLAI